MPMQQCLRKNPHGQSSESLWISEHAEVPRGWGIQRAWKLGTPSSLAYPMCLLTYILCNIFYNKLISHNRGVFLSSVTPLNLVTWGRKKAEEGALRSFHLHSPDRQGHCSLFWLCSQVFLLWFWALNSAPCFGRNITNLSHVPFPFCFSCFSNSLVCMPWLVWTVILLLMLLALLGVQKFATIHDPLLLTLGVYFQIISQGVLYTDSK